MKKQRSMDRLAPSIQRAHARVSRAWYLSILHGVLLLALGVHLLVRDEPAWVPAGLCLVGAAVVPLLGRGSYRGNSFSAFLLLLTVLVPAGWAALAGADMAVALAGLLLAPVYFLGLKGATGLRGRRASRAASARSATKRSGVGTSGGKRAGK